MKFDTLQSRLAIVLVGLLVLGGLAHPFNKRVKQLDPRFQMNDVLGRGVLFGMIGGYSSLISDFIWLKSYLNWEKKDVASCIADMQLAVKIDPSVVLFWSVGSSVIAHDMPHWIIAERPHTQTEINHVVKRQANLGIKFLDEGLTYLPNNVRLMMDKAIIYRNNLKDFDKALECYAEICEVPNAPAYAFMTYANMLVVKKKYKEAVNVLEKILSETSRDHPMYESVEAQIAEIKKLETTN